MGGFPTFFAGCGGGIGGRSLKLPSPSRLGRMEGLKAAGGGVRGDRAGEVITSGLSIHNRWLIGTTPLLPWKSSARYQNILLQGSINFRASPSSNERS